MSKILLPFLVLSYMIESFYGYETQRCRVTPLENGRVRERVKARNTIRFACVRGFQLVGAKYAHCVRGKWDGERPICVKPGCRPVSNNPNNAIYYPSHRGAVVKVVCNPGYVIDDDLNVAVVYCNGSSWNGTFPDCKVWNDEPACECSFNSSDVCGWMNDSNHDFDWVRYDPSSGKTSLIKDESSFLYIENLYHTKMNKSGRLFSPVYPPNYSFNSCFSFHYILNGDSTGTLKVYMKEESLTLKNTEPLFWVEGNQGINWHEGFFQLTPTDQNFQFVIECTRDCGYLTAIRAVSLKFGDACQNNISTTDGFTTDITTTDSFDSMSDFSCNGRCGETSALAGTNITSQDLEEDPKCDCHSLCTVQSTCCLDFLQYCSYLVNSVKINETTAKAANTAAGTTRTTQGNAFFHHESFYSVTNNPATVTTATTSVLMPNVNNDSTKLQITEGTNRSNSIITPIYVKSYVTTMTTRTTATSILPSSTTLKKYITKNTLESTTTSTPTKAPPMKTTTTITFKPVSSTGKKYLPTATTKKSAKENKMERKTFLNEVTVEKDLPVKSHVHSEHSKSRLEKDHEAELSNTYGAKILIGTSSACLLLIVGLAFVVWRKRRRSAMLNSITEDSDVRFLTSDENLDFTLARPADDSL